MKKVFLISLFLILNGCSFQSFSALLEVDKVEVVKKNASISHYRAYFTRTQLRPIKDKQKYLYFYNKKNKDLAILLYKNKTYTLYPIYHPNSSTLQFNAEKFKHYVNIKKALKEKGYVPTSLQEIAAISKIALRKYKGIKTLLVEIKDYSKLQRKYKYAIKHYDSSGIVKIKTTLPHSLINHYFTHYKKRAISQKQKKELNIIAKKLHLLTPSAQTKEETHEIEEALALEIPEEDKKSFIKKSYIPYIYYTEEASYHELNTYLKQSKVKDTLSFNQYTILTHRLAQLKEEKILKEGSLEELIHMYKINKKPQFKQRILELMKKAQK